MATHWIKLLLSSNRTAGIAFSLMSLVPGVLQYMAHVKFWRPWCRSSDKFHSIPSWWNISWNSTFRLTIRYPTTFPRPAKALTVSQPENVRKPGSDLHTIAPTLSTILETSIYLTLVCESHLMNTEDGIKLLKAKRSTKTSVSSDTMTTEANLDLTALRECKSIRVSASSWVDSSSLIGCTTPDNNW